MNEVPNPPVDLRGPSAHGNPGWLSDARDTLHEGLREPALKLRLARATTAMRSGWREGVRYAPALVLGIAFTWYAAGGFEGRPRFPAWVALACVPLAPLLLAVVHRTLARRTQIDDLAVANTLSRELADRERLAAATDLARGTPATGTFAQAAIEDGLDQIERARRVEFAAGRAAGRTARAWLLAIAFGTVPLWLQPKGSGADADSTASAVRAATSAKEPDLAARAASRPNSRPDPEPASRPEAGSRPLLAAAKEAPRERKQERSESPERGASSAAAGSAGANAESGASQSKSKQPKGNQTARANAASAGAAGSEAGSEAPEAQEQPEAKAQKKSPRAKPKTPQPPRSEPETPKDGGGAQSGAARSGAQGSPVAAGQRLRDPVREGQQDANAEEDPAEDEPETSEQRGGAAPPSRDRQKSPSRELTISGDGPPQDGRGGPTPPKKARGTASLILGVTVPDHVHGRPNPGTNKQSLADAPPREESHPLAEVAPARTGTPAHPQSPGAPRDYLAPFVLRFHELLRTQTQGTSTTEPNHEQRNR